MFSFYYKTYIAMIGDIKNSRGIAERNEIQKKLKDVLKCINEKYDIDIAAKFMITLGDEFQGLLRSGRNAVEIIEFIQQEMYPIDIRFGIGIGEITTDIIADMAIGADGPGYYNARAAIEQLKVDEQKSKIQASDIKIKIQDDRNSVAQMLNTIFMLLDLIKENWTERQREIIWELRKNNINQSECALKFAISQSSVQRILSSGNYYAYKEAIETINSVFEEVGRK